jgi:hypothetical protein
VGARALGILGTTLQASVNVHAADDDRMPYWGEGARLGGLDTPTGSGAPPSPYRYHDRRLFASAALRGGLLGPLGWHARARWLDVGVAEPRALLASARPPGTRGGRTALGEIGLLWDARDREVGTRRGLFLAAALFAAPQIRGVSDFAFHGYDATARAYVPLGLGTTLALRALYDRKMPGVPRTASDVEAVPFFERMLYEGLAFDEGMGSAATIRGIARYRISGDEKGARERAAPTRRPHDDLAAKTQEWGLDVGVDAAWARQPGYAHVDAAGLAAGLRFIWDRTILLRVEMGRAFQGGERTLYVAFGEQF